MDFGENKVKKRGGCSYCSEYISTKSIIVQCVVHGIVGKKLEILESQFLWVLLLFCFLCNVVFFLLLLYIAPLTPMHVQKKKAARRTNDNAGT